MNRTLIITLVASLMLAGVVVGAVFASSYAVPMQRSAETEYPGAEAFKSTCIDCHDTDKPENYQGDLSWADVITLMKSYGAFIADDKVQDIEKYLQAAYPR